MNNLNGLLSAMTGIDGALDAIDPAELDRTIESLETLRTLYNARRSSRERIENGRRTTPAISLAMMTADPAAASEMMKRERDDGQGHRPNQIEQAEHNRATVVEWLREHQPASIDDISLATRIKPAAVRYIVAEQSLCSHDASTPYRYSLLEQHRLPAA